MRFADCQIFLFLTNFQILTDQILMWWEKLVCIITEVFDPVFFKIYRALMRLTPWSFLREVAVKSPHDGGTHLEWGKEGWGMRTLSQCLSDVSLSYLLKHISTGEHSLHISWRSTHLLYIYIFPVFMMTSSNGNMFRVIGFCAGNSPVTAGNSPVSGEIPSQTSDAELWCFLWSVPERTIE